MRRSVRKTEQNEAKLGSRVEDALTMPREQARAVSPRGQATKKQEEFERMNERWLKKQRKNILKAIKKDQEFSKKVFKQIRNIKVPKPYLTPGDMIAGDAILVGPPGDPSLSSRISQAQAMGDLILRKSGRKKVANWLKDAVLGRNHDGASPSTFSHVLVYLGRDRYGHKRYLDPQLGEGRRIIGEAEFKKRYFSRPMMVARLRFPKDGKNLMKAGLEEVMKAGLDEAKKGRRGRYGGTDFGVVGKEDAVCSEVVGIVLDRAIKKDGKQIVFRKRFGPVYMTPTDFVDRDVNGRYFVVTPLVLTKSDLARSRYLNPR